MHLIDAKGSRPICRGCRRAAGPVGRKRWTCLNCQIHAALRRGDVETYNALILLRYVREEKRRAG